MSRKWHKTGQTVRVEKSALLDCAFYFRKVNPRFTLSGLLRRAARERCGSFGKPI